MAVARGPHHGVHVGTRVRLDPARSRSCRCADQNVRPDIVLELRRQQKGLLAALAALERAIRHAPNRTLNSQKCRLFLPNFVGRLRVCSHRKPIHGGCERTSKALRCPI